jgi:hypothetical protein
MVTRVLIRDIAGKLRMLRLNARDARASRPVDGYPRDKALLHEVIRRPSRHCGAIGLRSISVRPIMALSGVRALALVAIIVAVAAVGIRQ